MKARHHILAYGTLILAFGFLLGTVEALPQYTISDFYSGSPSFNGGPFIVDPVGPEGTFLTFCIERNEYLSFGGTYYGSTESYAIYGGTGGASGGQDPVDNRTAYLYRYFLANEPSLNPYQEIAIQLAIWRIEEEVDATYSAYSGILSLQWGGTGNTIGQWADYYWGQANLNPNYPLNVMALNLWGNENRTEPKQTLLIAVPEPSTLLLLGMGLLGGAIVVSRRRRKA